MELQDVVAQFTRGIYSGAPDYGEARRLVAHVLGSAWHSERKLQGTKCSDNDAVDSLALALDGIARRMGRTDVDVTAAKQWIRDLGSLTTASKLGKLSKARNTQAHPLVLKILAEVDELLQKRKQKNEAERQQPQIPPWDACNDPWAGAKQPYVQRAWKEVLPWRDWQGLSRSSGNKIEAESSTAVVAIDSDASQHTECMERWTTVVRGKRKLAKAEASASLKNFCFAKQEAEQKAKEEAKRKAKEEAELKATQEAEQKAKEEAERKAKAEADERQRTLEQELDGLKAEQKNNMMVGMTNEELLKAIQDFNVSLIAKAST